MRQVAVADRSGAMTEAELAELEAAHHVAGPTWAACVCCAELWPCAVTRLVREVRRLLQEKVELLGERDRR